MKTIASALLVQSILTRAAALAYVVDIGAVER
jgi:hypothetical protein